MSDQYAAQLESENADLRKQVEELEIDLADEETLRDNAMRSYELLAKQLAAAETGERNWQAAAMEAGAKLADAEARLSAVEIEACAIEEIACTILADKLAAAEARCSRVEALYRDCRRVLFVVAGGDVCEYDAETEADLAVAKKGTT